MLSSYNVVGMSQLPWSSRAICVVRLSSRHRFFPCGKCAYIFDAQVHRSPACLSRSCRMSQLACSPCPPNILLCYFVLNLHAFVLISYNVVGMSQLSWSSRAICVVRLSSRHRFPLREVCLYIWWGCLGSCAHFVRFLRDVSAPVIALPPSSIVVAVVVVAG